MSAILLDSLIVHYEVIGRGQPVIFLHDWVGSWRYWISSMQAISAQSRGYALDLWGFGDTAKQAEKYPLKDQELLLEGFIEQMGMAQVTLVGHGLGGILAAYYAAEQRERVRRVLFTSFPCGSSSLSPRLTSATPTELASWLFGKSPALAPVKEDTGKTDPQAIALTVSQFAQVDWRRLVQGISLPSLWIHGLVDPVINPPGDDDLTFLPEVSQFHAFANTGHFPMLDEASKFNRLLMDFLTLEPHEDLAQIQIKEEWKRLVR